MASSLFELSYTIIVVGIVYSFLKKEKYLSFKKEAFHWILFGFVINFYGLSWLYTVYPLSFMEKGAPQLLALFLLHLILASLTALPYSLLAFYKRIVIHNQARPFLFGSLLTLSELFRSLIITILYYGEKGTIALHFTAGTIGNALSTTPFIEFAYFGGTFALTFILGYLVVIIVSKENFYLYWNHGLGILVILFLIHTLVPVHTPKQGTVIGIITTNSKAPKQEEDYLKLFKEQTPLLHKLTLSLSSSSPSLIVYPEDTRYISSLTPTQKTDLLLAFKDTLFVDGDVLTYPYPTSNVSIFYTPKKNKAIARGKELLLPFNEYIPYFFKPLFTLFIQKEALNDYTRLHTYTPTYSKKTILHHTTRVGTLICSEILSYSVIEKVKKEHPDVVIFQSRLSVFHNNPWFLMHLRSFTKVAAAQLRTTVLGSGEGAPSYTVSPYGTILLTIEDGARVTRYVQK